MSRRGVACSLALAVLVSACGEESETPPARRPTNTTCHAPPRTVPAGSEGLPARLSETGCFDPADATRALPALIPYAVNAPLWSDGATKERWMALPDGARIRVLPDGDLDLPAGTVLVKTFQLGGKRLETRFFVRHPDGEWSGFTYAWNDAGTDAALVDEGGGRRPVGSGEWHLPTRVECRKCHTAAAGHTLGLELAQLDRTERGANQLALFSEMGLFESAVDPAAVAALPVPSDATAPLEGRARAYLHANCAGCHRPEVDNSGSTDFRFTTALAATMTCDATPLKGSLGLGPEMRIIAPGSPEHSMAVHRMKILESGRMPTIASLSVDDAGIALISTWIASLQRCP